MSDDATTQSWAFDQARRALQEGDRFAGVTLKDRYQVKERIGAGGFGDVYRATDLNLAGREVVVKTLRERRTGAAASWFDKRFDQEKRALAMVEHPSVVGVLDAGEGPDGVPFLVMQFVRGRTLRVVLADGPMELSRIWRLTAQLANGLEAVHAVRVLHRDIKPENIIVRDPGALDEVGVLIDFGIARIETAESNDATTGYISGSPAYMAPEQGRGNAVPSSDQYALALVVFEALTGRKLRELDKTGDASEAAERWLAQLRPEVPAGSRAALQRALAFDPNDRFPSLTDFSRAVAPLPQLAVSRRIALVGYAAALASGGLITYGIYRLGAPPASSRLPVSVMQKVAGVSVLVDPAEAVFHTGDQIRIQFTPPAGGFLYIFSESPMSRPNQPRLFRIHAGPVEGLHPVSIPARANSWIRVLGSPGIEVFWLIWSPAELRWLEGPRSGPDPIDRDEALALQARLEGLRSTDSAPTRLIVREVKLRHE